MNQKSSNIFKSFFYTLSETETGCKKTLKTTTIPIHCGLKIDQKKIPEAALLILIQKTKR
jgi:hypothetical protein